MARKSRRVNGNKSAIEISSDKIPVTIAGIYLRLSSKDKADKDSIHNQKAIIEHYLEDKLQINVFKYYVDDGVSSYKDFRPAFEEMMQDIKCGLINTVIVKDISRFGRNYIETGTYLETIFPRIGIRFISVSEEIDSLDKNKKEFEIAIKSLLNHFYSQDISAKVKSVVKQKQISGEYVAARLPYGYEKLVVEGRTICVPNQEKAEVVKRIFELIFAGASYYKISGKLNLAGVKSPGDNDWNVKAVSRIINNRFYTGALEMGKTENTLGGMKPFINKEKQAWITLDNHHQAIIDMDTFENIQRIIEAKKNNRLKTNIKIIENSEAIKTYQGSRFDRLLYCGDCRRKMKKQVWAEKIYYVCPKYSETNGSCSLKSWRVDRIINALIREIEDRIFILGYGPEEHDKGVSFKDNNILLFQNEIDRLTLKREFIYDTYMESDGYDGNNLRKDLDLIDEKIKNTENEINELSYQENMMRQVQDKINLLKQVVEDLKVQNNADNDNVQDFDCIIKKVNVFENQLEIEY